MTYEEMQKKLASNSKLKRAMELFEILREKDYERFLWFEDYLTALVECGGN